MAKNFASKAFWQCHHQLVMEMHSSRIFPHLKCSFGSIVRKTFSAIAKKKKPRNAFEDFTSPSLFSWTTETAGAYCSIMTLHRPRSWNFQKLAAEQPLPGQAVRTVRHSISHACRASHSAKVGTQDAGPGQSSIRWPLWAGRTLPGPRRLFFAAPQRIAITSSPKYYQKMQRSITRKNQEEYGPEVK